MSIKIPETEVDEATLTMIVDDDLIPVVCLGGDPDQLALLTDQIMSIFSLPLNTPKGFMLGLFLAVESVSISHVRVDGCSNDGQVRAVNQLRGWKLRNQERNWTIF